ncbi:hypothetical protein [Paenibacillus pseudetheri]|uniref:hypothetical protein n=1 Tax=Paenibacillus pseudetheri TaxID=2897682 RepID=UPI001F1B7BB6|nr:hypothetical protein [Paenibacillus pseudetheri]
MFKNARPSEGRVQRVSYTRKVKHRPVSTGCTRGLRAVCQGYLCGVGVTVAPRLVTVDSGGSNPLLRLKILEGCTLEQPLLEKYECLSEECGGQFLVNMEKSKGKNLACPFCKRTAEATVSENPDV